MLTDELDDVFERLGELALRLSLALGITVGVVLIGRMLRPVVRSRLNRRGRPSFTRVFLGLYGLLVALGGFLLAVTAVFPSVEVADVLASLGILSVAVGFAFKNVLENLLAGVLLLLRDPFQSGDQISVAGYQGTVEGITVRETLLRTYDGRRVLVPNSTVYVNPLEVGTHYPQLRSAFTTDIATDSDLDTARLVARDALAATPGVDADPPPEVVVTAWTSTAITVECRFWTAAPRRDRTQALDAAIGSVRDAYARAGILAPTDQLEVDLRSRPDAPPAGSEE